MFKVGDYIVYGSVGVCKVEKVGSVEFSGIGKDRQYYTLLPVYTKGSTVFTPVDNKKVLMRPIISKEEAMELIHDIQNIELLWMDDDTRREAVYKEALQKQDCKELIKIIKTTYQRKQSKLAEGKKVPIGDEKYFKLAEDYLYGELAISFGMEKEQVKEFIIDNVTQDETFGDGS